MDLVPRYTDALVAVSLVVAAAGFGAVPWASSLELLCVTLFVFGIGLGMSDIGEGHRGTVHLISSRSILLSLPGLSLNWFLVGTHTVLLNMWGSKSAMALHAMHFCFGVGALLAPQIAKPFLRDPHAMEAASNTSLYASTQNSSDIAVQEIPFAIAAAGMTIGAVLMMIFQCLPVPDSSPQRQAMKFNRSLCSPKNCGQGSAKRGLFYMALLWVYLFNSVGSEYSFEVYLYTYATEKANPMSIAEAADLSTVYSSAFTGTRLVSIVVSKFVSVDNVMLGGAIGFVAMTTALSIWAFDNNIVLWIFAPLTGSCIAVQYPSGIAWSSLYLNINSVTTMVPMTGGKLGAVTFKYATGNLFSSTGIATLMYLVSCAAVLLATVYITMHICTRKQRRAKKRRDDAEEGEEMEKYGKEREVDEREELEKDGAEEERVKLQGKDEGTED